MSCTNCKDKILNGTPTLIGNTKCNGDCPEQIGCTDPIPSECVFFSGAGLECYGVQYGDSITKVIQTFNKNLGVRVSDSDTCCGYLPDKLVSDTITISTDTVNGCQVVRLEAPSGQSSTDEKVKVSINDPNAGYLLDKLSSENGTVLITDLGSTVNLEVACPAKVKVNSDDELCDYLAPKFIEGSVYPLIDTTNPQAPKIKFQRQGISFVKDFNNTLPVSSVNGCANSYRSIAQGGFAVVKSSFPLPCETCLVNPSGVLSYPDILLTGIPTGTNWAEISGSNTFPQNSPNTPTIGTIALSTSQFQGSNSASVIILQPGVYDITLTVNLILENSDNCRSNYFGNDGFFFTFLQFGNASGTTNNAICPIKDIISSIENRSFFSTIQKNVVVTNNQDRLFLRIVNSVGTINNISSNSGVYVGIEKVG